VLNRRLVSLPGEMVVRMLLCPFFSVFEKETNSFSRLFFGRRVTKNQNVVWYTPSFVSRLTSRSKRNSKPCAGQTSWPCACTELGDSCEGVNQFAVKLDYRFLHPWFQCTSFWTIIWMFLIEGVHCGKLNEISADPARLAPRVPWRCCLSSSSGS